MANKVPLRETTRPKKRKKKIGIFKIILIIILMAAAITLGAASGKVMAIINSAPSLSPNVLLSQNLSTSVYAKDSTGKWVRIANLYGNDNREWVSLKQIPVNLQNAVIAIEDVRFRQHHGIDIKRILGAIVADLKSHSYSEGGSTITQQLVKNTILTDDPTLKRKIQEAVLAWKLENIYSKDQILEAYLNTINLCGPDINAYGVQAAAQSYFKKDVSQLDLAESAIIAGITNNPSMYSPEADQKAAKQRQELILSKMLEYHMITKEQYNEAVNEKLHYQFNQDSTIYQHQDFVDQVITDVIQDLASQEHISQAEASNKIYNGGYKIYTTMDFNVQNAIEKNFANNKLFPLDEKVTSSNNQESIQPQGAMVIMDPKTGEVKGLLGRRGTAKGKFLLDRATQMKRSPGSSIKPITVYTPAIDNGYTAASVLDDSPVTFNIPGSGPWSPKNYESGYYRGLVTIRTAIANSINVVAAKLVMAMGTQTSYNYATKFGLHLTNEDKYSPAALSLGGLTNGVSPLEMCAAYATLDNQGVYITPTLYTKVTDRNDNVVIEKEPTKRSVVSPQVAYIMTNLMKSVVQYGTGTNAQIPNMPVAGKTGTTSDEKDAWFDGFTPYYVGVVWMGYDEPKTMYDRNGNPVTGGSYPAMMWSAVMKDIHKNLKYKDFVKPEGIVSATVCKDSGDLPTDLCRLDPRGNQLETELFIQGTVPTKYCDVHVLASVDTKTGLLASPNTPPAFVKQGVYLNIPNRTPYQNSVTEDGKYVLPTKTDPINKGGTVTTPDNGKTADSNTNSSGNGNQGNSTIGNSNTNNGNSTGNTGTNGSGNGNNSNSNGNTKNDNNNISGGNANQNPPPSNTNTNAQ